MGFSRRYDKDQLLFRIWENWGVDSMTGGWDYVEPVMFSYAAGEVIETAYHVLARPGGNPVIAHFHEWMSGAGLLYLKRRIPEIATVFTTHATILGRTLSGTGMDLYGSMEHLSPQKEAGAHNISAKFSLEQVSAREADCFTTVSEITALEARNILGRAPDAITPNGLDMRIPGPYGRPGTGEASRLPCWLRQAFSFTGIFPGPRLFMTSGRYEFPHKGIDVFWSLGRLAEMEAAQSAVAILFVMAPHGPLPSLQTLHPDRSGSPPIARIAFLRLLGSLSGDVQATGPRTARTGQHHFVPAPLDGNDGSSPSILRAHQGCDMAFFPLITSLGIHAPGVRGLRLPTVSRSGRIRAVGPADDRGYDG